MLKLLCSFFIFYFLPTITGGDDFSGSEGFPSLLFPIIMYKVQSFIQLVTQKRSFDLPLKKLHKQNVNVASIKYLEYVETFLHASITKDEVQESQSGKRRRLIMK